MSRHPFGDASPARELSCLLADRVEAVCRYYLSNGVRSGCYWIVGDTGNTKGRSLFVRLTGPVQGKGARGKWRDAATGEHGDLLDLIREREGHRNLGETLREARRFLGRPDIAPKDGYARVRDLPRVYDTGFIARRIWSECLPLAGSLAETYLLSRCLPPPYPHDLRFHPALEYRDHKTGEVTFHPALVVTVRDIQGSLRGIQRTWLGPDGVKALLDDPRRSLGRLNGHGAWLRHGDRPRNGDREGPSGCLLIGEGVETVLSVGDFLPATALVAALSAAHLTGFILPGWVRHLLIIRDNDPAGIGAARKLAERAEACGITVTTLRPVLKDFNADLRQLGKHVLAGILQRQGLERMAA